MPHNKTYLSALDKSKLDELKEVKLAKLKKLHLSLTDDAEKITADIEYEMENIQDSISEADELIKEVQTLNNTFDRIYEQLEDSIKEAEKLKTKGLEVFFELRDGADNLGLDVNDIKQAVDLDVVTVEVDDSITEADSTLDRLADNFNK